MNKGIFLQWHSFSIALKDVTAWLTTNLPSYTCRLSANSKNLIVKFDSEPSSEDITTLKDWWNAIISTDTEATNYVSQATIAQAVADARDAAMGKNWDVMSAAERKAVAGLTPTLAELGL